MAKREKEELWEKVMGQWVDPGDIEDLFLPGSECSGLWGKIYDCEQRMMERMGVEECRELEDMFYYYNKICRIVSLRMFDYGAEFAMKK